MGSFRPSCKHPLDACDAGVLNVDVEIAEISYDLLWFAALKLAVAGDLNETCPLTALSPSRIPGFSRFRAGALHLKLVS